jgi:hypothetical protein
MPSVFSIHLYIELGITHCYGNFPGSLKLKPSENRQKWQGNRENINFPKAIFFGIYELGLLGGKHGCNVHFKPIFSRTHIWMTHIILLTLKLNRENA